jgi:serine/threonine-protein kinase
VAAAALAAGMLAWFIRAPADMPVRRFSLQPPGEGSVFSAVLSPTGNAMALIVDDRVWLQKLDAFEASVVPASDGARAVFWSPDGAFVGFQARGQLWKTATAGGQPIAIGRVPQDFTSAGGAAWIDDRIVFTSGGTGLFEMPAEGGEARLLVEVDPAQETDLHNAAALPDSRGVLFISHLLRGAGRGWRLDLATPEDGAPKALLSARRPLFTAPEPIFNPAYSPSGHVLFQQGADVWALPFSLSSLSVTGEPFRLASNARNASADAAGTLVMVSGGGLGANLQLVWIDRTRRVTPASRQTMASANFPRISPDGRFAAAVDAVGDAGDIWIIDLERGTDRRLTFEPGGDTVPAWTPDGQFIVYQCDSAGDEAVSTICARRADGGGARVELLKGVRGAPTLSPDGRFLLFTRESDLWIVEIGKRGFSVPLEAEPRRLIAANRDQRYAEVSPDGRFVAYESSEGGTWKVFVTRFPSGEGKWQILGGYAAWPRWSPKGDRLYVADDAQHIVEIEVDLKTTFSAGARIVRIPAGVFPGSGFDRAPDGSRFLVGQPQSDVGRRSSILVVQNWRAPER